jgi:hypothetical protein
VRRRILALVLAALATACTRTPIAPSTTDGGISILPVPSQASPSPLVEIRIGHVRGVIPRTWEARMLPKSHLAREGFVASPNLARWERGKPYSQGIEAFWVDGARLRIPSDYYYLAARNASFGQLAGPRACGDIRSRVLVNHPPDFTGRTLSPSDFVASAVGTCLRGGRSTHWAYVVAAPGFGPVRRVGIPTSGLYVVVAEVTGPGSARLLTEIMKGARFDSASIGEIVDAAHRAVV